MTGRAGTPAEQLRAFVVRYVVLAIIGLAYGLYALVGYLLITQTAAAVPDALWFAAGGGAGTLGTLLLNSKGDQAANTATVELAAPAALATDAALSPDPQVEPVGDAA